MPLKNIELRHGGRYDSFIWRIEIPSNKKEAYKPRLCWVNKKPFTIGERLYFFVDGEWTFLSSSREELVEMANKKVLYDADNYVLSFIFDGYDVRHFVGRKKADILFKKNYSADDLF